MKIGLLVHHILVVMWRVGRRAKVYLDGDWAKSGKTRRRMQTRLFRSSMRVSLWITNSRARGIMNGGMGGVMKEDGRWGRCKGKDCLDGLV